jgi:hypothetical protein
MRKQLVCIYLSECIGTALLVAIDTEMVEGTAETPASRQSRHTYNDISSITTGSLKLL